MKARLTPALIVIDVLLALALAALWLLPGPFFAHWRNWQAPAPQAPNLDAARAARLAPSPALQRDYPAITQRPLFAADRQPRATAEEQPASAAALADDIDKAKLYGLVDGQGALLEQDGQTQFLRLGEKIGNWTLQTIEGRNAIFVKGGERRTVSLRDSLTDAAAIATPPPARAQPPVPAQNTPPRPATPARATP